MDAAWAESDVIIERRIVNHRTAGSPIEPRVVLADYRGGSLTLHLTSQNPHLIRLFMAGQMELSEDHVRVIAPDVGGGFGVKITEYPEEILASWASRKLGRAIKWTETRSEHLSSSIHGRDQIDFVKVGAKRDGTIVGLECLALADFGAFYTMLTPFIPSFTGFVISGCYKIPNLKFTARGVFTNKMATDATRGAGRPEATHLIEVMIDQLAARAGDGLARAAAEELHPEGGLPRRGGDRDRLRLRRLPRLARQAAHARRRRRRSGASRRSCAGKGIYRGIGFSTWMEICGLAPSRVVGPTGVGLQAGFYESAQVRVHATGSATVYSGTAPHGQGLDTAFAQIVADKLGINPDMVDVVHGDTGTGPFGLGTYGSRSLAVGGESIARSTNKVVDKVKAIAAHKLEAAPEDIELTDGKFSVKGSPDKGLTLAEVAGAAYVTMDMPEGMEPGLEESTFYDPENFVFPFGAHACIVDVDVETGKIDIVRYVCGRRLRPGDQPEADRRPDPRRHHARHRPGALRAHPLRRRRPAGDGHVRRLRAAQRRRRPELRDRSHGDPVAGQLARRQGRGGGRHDRRQPRDRQRGDRRAAPARRRLHRHAARARRTCGSRSSSPRAAGSPARPGQAGRLVGRARERQRRLRTDQPERGRCAVIPAEFDYVRPASLDEALARCATGGEDAKLLAGGHSLIPLMKLRLAAPALLVDLGGVPGLTGHRARQRRLADRRDDPPRRRWCASATSAWPRWWRARSPTRRSATAGRSAARSPTATRPPTSRRSCSPPRRRSSIRGENGEREIPAAELFLDYLKTAVGDGEVLTEIRLPAMEGYGFGYQKFNRRQEDWAMVARRALVKKAADGTCEDVRVGLTHMGSVPLRATAVEEALRGQPLDANSIAAAAEHAAEGTEPPADLNASADYKRHLARVLTRRALTDAAA